MFVEFCSVLLVVRQVRGELPFQKCKPVLDSVEFLDRPTKEELGSGFADIISQMALDVSCTIFRASFGLLSPFAGLLWRSWAGACENEGF